MEVRAISAEVALNRTLDCLQRVINIRRAASASDDDEIRFARARRAGLTGCDLGILSDEIVFRPAPLLR